MSDWSNNKAPSAFMRVIGTIGMLYIAVYFAIGVWRDDLIVSLSKNSGSGGVHLHGFLAWLCFSGYMILETAVDRFIACLKAEPA